MTLQTAQLALGQQDDPLSGQRIPRVVDKLRLALIALLMAFAIVFHLRRNERNSTPINVLLLVIAGFVAYGRSVMAPF